MTLGKIITNAMKDDPKYWKVRKHRESSTRISLTLSLGVAVAADVYSADSYR